MSVATWLFDVDGTAFQTFTPPPGGLDVHAAYERAVEVTFGAAGLRRYRDLGGLRNRAPYEIVAELAPKLPPDQLSKRAEEIVQIKLECLEPQIGSPVPGGVWPLPTAGFVPFWHALAPYREAKHLRTGVISSGHTKIIERFFKLYDLQLPDVIVSDDDVRWRRYPAAERRVKPGAFQFALARYQLAVLKDGQVVREHMCDKSRIIYFGDDPVKDGGLAQTARVQFGFFDPEHRENGRLPNSFRFSHWGEIEDRLTVELAAQVVGRS